MPLKQESPSSPLARGKLSIPSLQVAFFQKSVFPQHKKWGEREGGGRLGAIKYCPMVFCEKVSKLPEMSTKNDQRWSPFKPATLPKKISVTGVVNAFCGTIRNIFCRTLVEVLRSKLNKNGNIVIKKFETVFTLSFILLYNFCCCSQLNRELLHVIPFIQVYGANNGVYPTEYIEAWWEWKKRSYEIQLNNITHRFANRKNWIGLKLVFKI